MSPIGGLYLSRVVPLAFSSGARAHSLTGSLRAIFIEFEGIPVLEA